MAKEATFQVRMDEDVKNQVESLYRSMGTTFADAVRIFAQQSIAENGMPFVVRVPNGKKRTLGAANGKYRIPEHLDFCDDEIADIFGVSE